MNTGSCGWESNALTARLYSLVIWTHVDYNVLQGYWVMVVNVLFSLLAVFHLTYLGSMFDADMDDQAIEEVRNAPP